MLLRFIKTNKYFFIGIVSFIQISFASASEYNKLLRQQQRPTVTQIRNLLEDWTPAPLVAQPDLPKEKEIQKRMDLHFNYPLWYQLLIDGAPQMIATFEEAFPGATWAFMGRDMAILADLFEAFYDSIGQSNRVVRINISSPVIQSGLFSDEIALEYLNQNGLPKNRAVKHPFIFIDAVSSNSGVQGRKLINILYSSEHYWKSLGLQQRSELPWWINMIGLNVYTTALAPTPFRQISQLLDTYSHELESRYKRELYSKDNILIYSDGRAKNTYEGTNESGYTHWTGAWHGSFQSWVRTSSEVVAESGEASSEEVKKAIINFQTHVISAVSKEAFLEKVKTAAQAQGFIFPLSRPVYSPIGVQTLLTQLRLAKDESEIRSILNSRKIPSLPIDGLYDVLPKIATPQTYTDLLKQLPSSEEKDTFVLDTYQRFLTQKMSANEITILLNATADVAQKRTIINSLLGTSSNPKEFLQILDTVRNSVGLIQADLNIIIENNLNLFFTRYIPILEEINRLVSLVERNSLLHQRIVAMAFDFIHTKEQYRTLIRPHKKSLFHRLSSEYRSARRKAKKRLHLNTFSIINRIL